MQQLSLLVTFFYLTLTYHTALAVQETPKISSNQTIEVQTKLKTHSGKTTALTTVNQGGEMLTYGIEVILDGTPLTPSALGYFFGNVSLTPSPNQSLQIEFIGRNTKAGDFYFTRDVFTDRRSQATLKAQFRPLDIDLSRQRNLVRNTNTQDDLKEQFLELKDVFYKRVIVPGYGKRLFKIEQYESSRPIKKGENIRIYQPTDPNFKTKRNDLGAAALAIAHTDKIDWDNLIDKIQSENEKYDYKATHNWGLFQWGKTISINGDITATQSNGTVYLATTNAVPSRGQIKLVHYY